MNPKSMTIIKFIILLTLNISFLNQSQATNKESTTTTLHKHHPKAHSPSSPLSNEQFTSSFQYEEFLEQCEKRMTSDCADQIIENIFKDDKSVNKTCCSKLINMGPDCHKELLNREKTLHEDKKYIAKSEHLWKRCEKIVGPVKDHGYPKLPPRRYRPGNEDFLKGCAEKMTEKCGTKIVAALFGGEATVDKKCCSKLLHMGGECHDEMVKRLLQLSEKSTKVNRGEVRKRSDQVWKHCEKIGK
ncbi:hypothetical protein BUALT_Bualt16G0006900 [Buddleja alternifolia]|uniref:Prolamin-like domain-containing protein n=1 Tax=Buddleja alternifolia TaxID=168488 RepID=A0AAV6WGC9_9LAMI|nr:hypothetical protein BUALT_Bualt16G0006900 [Buddleja alternifolia]